MLKNIILALVILFAPSTTVVAAPQDYTTIPYQTPEAAMQQQEQTTMAVTEEGGLHWGWKILMGVIALVIAALLANMWREDNEAAEWGVFTIFLILEMLLVVAIFKL